MCVYIHSRDLLKANVPVETLVLVPAWEEAGPVFSDQEKGALKWAGVVTRMVDTNVPDEAYSEARAAFTEKQLADLAIAIGLMNCQSASVLFRSLHQLELPEQVDFEPDIPKGHGELVTFIRAGRADRGPVPASETLQGDRHADRHHSGYARRVRT
jgi:hypothetical protein